VRLTAEQIERIVREVEAQLQSEAEALAIKAMMGR